MVKKHLIFRIKHKRGHWGEEDVVLIQNYVPPTDPNGDGGAPLIPKTPAPNVSAGWWATAGAGVPGHEDLLAALSRYDTIDRVIVGGDVSAAVFRQANDALSVMQDTARALMHSLANKQDKETMARFVVAVRDEVKALAKKREDFLKHKQDSLQAGLDNWWDDTASPEIEKAKKQVKDFGTFIKNGDFENANRYSALLFKTFDNRWITDPIQIKVGSDQSARLNGVDHDDLVEHIARSGRVKTAQGERTKVNETDEKFATALETAQAKITDHEYDHPDRTTSTDPTYRGHLAEISAEFRGVLQAIQSAVTQSSTHRDTARTLQKLAEKGRAPTDLLDRVQAIVDDFTAINQATVFEYAKIRNNAGSTKVKEANYGIVAEDKAKFTSPILNRCMAVWYVYRTAEKEALKLLAEAVQAHALAHPDDQTILDAYNDIKARAASRRE